MLSSGEVNGVANAVRGNIDVTYTLVANSLNAPSAVHGDNKP